MDKKTKILIVEDQFVEANHLRIMLKKAGYEVSGIARSVDDARSQVATDRPGLVLLDIFLSGKETGIDLARYLKKENIAFIYLSASSNEDILNAAKATQPYGFLVKPFREKDLFITMEIAHYHQEHGIESAIRKENIFQQQLKELSASSGNWEERLLKLSRSLQPLIPFDFILSVYKFREEDNNTVLGFFRIGFDEYEKISIREFQAISKLKEHEIKEQQKNVHADEAILLHAGGDFEDLTHQPGMPKIVAGSFGMRCNLTLPVHLDFVGPAKFTFLFFSRQPYGFTNEHLEICERLQPSLIYAVQNLVAKDIKIFSAAESKKQLQATVDTNEDKGFHGIIGKSSKLLTIFDQVAQVASSDTSVLIIGESGTGKEAIAENLHQLSKRRPYPMIKVNCAALPANLIESELFGHERGSFTGATEKRIGRFEQADKGTLFLDEIGEMHLDVQVKLLRALQEREIERIGGKSTIRVDVRIIAATNRNLEKEVAEGRFRLDLYYRLNVFPIQMPALRERKEDIGMLTQHFIRHYSQRTGKQVNSISDSALKNLLGYHWPGNIRELENLIERSILLCKGDVIEEIPLPVMHKENIEMEKNEWYTRTIQENEREHIIAVLSKCNGRIRGAGGAAEILGVPPTTLASKIKKLGIKRVIFSL